jgi:hypothetical protein
MRVFGLTIEPVRSLSGELLDAKLLLLPLLTDACLGVDAVRIIEYR